MTSKVIFTAVVCSLSAFTALAQQNTPSDPLAHCQKTDSAAVGPEAIKIVVHGPVLRKEPYHFELLIRADGAITLHEKHKKNGTKTKKVTPEAVQRALRDLEDMKFFDDECCYPSVVDGGWTSLTVQMNGRARGCSENDWPASHLKEPIDKVLAALDIRGWVQWPH